MRQHFDVKKLVLTSILLAIIIILQLLSALFKIGIFQISLVAVPITIGAILLGPKTGAILGFGFGVIVLLAGDAAFFMAHGAMATVFIVLLKGTIAGMASGLIYKLFKNNLVGSIVSSITFVITNTAIFAVGTLLFLFSALKELDSSNPIKNLFLVIIGVNFIIELISTILLVPATKRIIEVGNKIYIDKK